MINKMGKEGDNSQRNSINPNEVRKGGKEKRKATEKHIEDWRNKSNTTVITLIRFKLNV
jgi:hypothetical protein